MRRLFYLLFIILIVGIFWLALRPQPVSVDLARVTRGAMQVTVHDDGKTRIREKYVVSTPVAGRLLRIDLRPGDSVTAGETQLTVIEPSDPTLLDPRALAEARAREQAAATRLMQLEPRLQIAEKRLNFAETEFGRIRRMFQQSAASQQQLDQHSLTFEEARTEYADLKFLQTIAEYEHQLARAALIHTGQKPDEAAVAAFTFPIISPITGQVLRVIQESSTFVSAGAPLLELGDPRDLEVEVDVLSHDAVRIQRGAQAYLDQWGGDAPIPARVRLVEPSAFTKISALGIEEQRVRVVLDFEQIADDSDPKSQLGDGYRVEARIVIWEGTDVLMIPAGALFRQGRDWSVFRNDNGMARTTLVEIGRRNDTHAEVLSGLNADDEIVVHPGDQLTEGVRISRREL